MSRMFDELSKAIGDESLPRRESLLRLGLAITATVLSPLGAEFARAGHRPKGSIDPCKACCRCRNKKQQDQCLKACKACGSNPSRLGGSCGNYFCCAAGLTSCGSYCADLANDPDNCGECGYNCAEPGPNEYGACFDGECRYACFEGADFCDGVCTFLDSDPDNCGACGNVCPGSAPYCDRGTCRSCPAGQTLCDGSCVDLDSDPDNCGACGYACGGDTPYCYDGACTYCGGYGVAICDGVCVFIDSDNNNCGACGVQCAQGDQCTGGICLGSCSGCQ